MQGRVSGLGSSASGPLDSVTAKLSDPKLVGAPLDRFESTSNASLDAVAAQVKAL
jgi:hypothetical protein